MECESFGFGEDGGFGGIFDDAFCFVEGESLCGVEDGMDFQWFCFEVVALDDSVDYILSFFPGWEIKSADGIKTSAEGSIYTVK